MKNPLKIKYFVCAKIKTQKKGASKITDNLHNGVIDVWKWQKKDHTMLNGLTMMFANNVAEQNKDLKVKEVVIISMNRI